MCQFIFDHLRPKGKIKTFWVVDDKPMVLTFLQFSSNRTLSLSLSLSLSYLLSLAFPSHSRALARSRSLWRCTAQYAQYAHANARRPPHARANRIRRRHDGIAKIITHSRRHKTEKIYRGTNEAGNPGNTVRHKQFRWNLGRRNQVTASVLQFGSFDTSLAKKSWQEQVVLDALNDLFVCPLIRTSYFHRLSFEENWRTRSLLIPDFASFESLESR